MHIYIIVRYYLPHHLNMLNSRILHHRIIPCIQCEGQTQIQSTAFFDIGPEVETELCQMVQQLCYLKTISLK